jgi:cystathionine beta-synthase
LKGVLNDAKIAIVTDREQVIGVISKIDLIDYLAQRATPAPV